MQDDSQAKRRKKPKSQYHHGDLSRALREETIRLIAERGAWAVTVREVGARLGVSRSALYRHYPDKQALLAAVAGEGFAQLRRRLADAWEAKEPSLDRFDAIGEAYVDFAIKHPSHYRVMFGGLVTNEEIGPEFAGESTNAFEVLAEAVETLQSRKLVQRGDPLAMACYTWSVVHGVAMLTLDGMLPEGLSPAKLMAYASQRIRAGIQS